MSNLLPPNATPTERALATLAHHATDLPVPISELLNPEKCPAHILPWLAWAFSVDEWDDAWTEKQKRNVIKASFTVHSRKGTRGAVRAALDALGYSSKIVEWFENDSPAYTFDVQVFITDTPISPIAVESMRRVVAAAKNSRSQFDINLVARLPGQLGIASAITTGRNIAIYPYAGDAIDTTPSVGIATGFTHALTVEVRPQ